MPFRPKGAKEIIGNPYQYPLAGQGVTTFVKGPVYENHIKSILAGSARGLSEPAIPNAVVNIFRYDPCHTAAVQSPNRLLIHTQTAEIIGTVSRVKTHVSYSTIPPHPLLYRLAHQPGITVSVNGIRSLYSQDQSAMIRQLPTVKNMVIPAPLTVEVPRLVVNVHTPVVG